jgi:diguanylate cyclase (GGDEF)-like protein
MARRVDGVGETLHTLASAVEADAGVWMLADRGDGALHVMSTGTAAAGPSVVAAAVRRLAKAMRDGAAAGPGALALVAIPDVRGGLLVLERQRREPFSAEDLSVARLYARQLADRVITGEGGRTIGWSSQLEAVQSVASQLTRLTTVEHVAAALCTETRRVIAFDNARVYVLGADGRTLEPVAFRSHAQEYAGETADGLRVRLGEGITGWVGATGQPLIVPDASRDPRALDVPGSPRLPESMLFAPLRSDARVIGVVALSRLGLDQFSEDDLRLLGVLADQAAVAIENARHLAARERLVSELATLLDISRAGGQATDEGGLAVLLAGKLRTAARADGCLIWRLEDESATLVCLGGDGLSSDGERRDSLAHHATRQVLLQGVERTLELDDPSVGGPERQRLAALGASSVMLLPLRAAGRVTGLVELVSRSPGRSSEPDQSDLLVTMVNQAAIALENVRLIGQLRQAVEVDIVSGVHSHRHLQDRLREEIARVARSGAPLSLLMVDLDEFKRINDVHGHQAGDRVLRSVGAALRAAVRAGDVVARYGGDEFVVLMPDTGAEDAEGVAERISRAIRASEHVVADDLRVAVGCSLGLAVYPRDGRTGKALLRAADAAMYVRKRSRETAPAQRRPAPEVLASPS